LPNLANSIYNSECHVFYSEDDVQLSRQSYVVDQETEGTEATEEDPALMDMLNSFVPGSPDSTGGK